MDKDYRYRGLLLKYLNHVLCEEGTNFLNSRSTGNGSLTINAQEFIVLKQLAKEAEIICEEESKAVKEKEKPSVVTFICPRSGETAESIKNSPFIEGYHGEAVWRSNDTCSYCGSMKPELFIQAITAGAEVIPTDKNYKVYVTGTNINRQKFYFQHLSQEQKNVFIKHYNEKTMKIGYPGHFYVDPYFCSPVV